MDKLNTLEMAKDLNEQHKDMDDLTQDIIDALSINDIKYNHEQLQNLMESFKDIKDAIANGNNIYVPALATSFQKAVDSKRAIIEEIKQMENYYLFDLLISQIIEDAVAPDVNTDQIMELSSAIPEVNEELDIFQSKFNLDALCLDLLPELIRYGNYCIKPNIILGKGITRIDDVHNGEFIIPITSHGEIEGYLYGAGESGSDIKIAPRYDFVSFTVIGTKLRIIPRKEIAVYYEDDTKGEDLLAKLPAYLRPGKPMFYPVLDKIKELQLLEALVPASKLAKLSNGTIIGVKVPANHSIDQAIRFARRVENTINKSVGVDPDTGTITIQNMINASGKTKVVPLFGDKGDLHKMDYHPDEPDDLLSHVQDLRKVIMESIGVPYELFFGGSDGKSNSLKKNSRYIRKLRTVQGSLTRGVQDLSLIHLINKDENKFKKVTRADINVQFKQKLVEIENLDKLEFVAATLASVEKTLDFVNKLRGQDSFLKDYLNEKEVAQYVSNQMNIVGLNIIDENKLKGATTDDNGKLPQKELPGQEEEPSTPPEADLQISEPGSQGGQSIATADGGTLGEPAI